MARTVNQNFQLLDTAFINGGSMDESGRCQIVKRFIYQIIDNSPALRRQALLDLEALVPVKGSCMSDDSRYTMKSAAWNCFSWQNQATEFFIDATYRRVSDDDEAGAPWNLSPFNIVHDSVEQEIPFKLAYNKKNKRRIPVVNSAGEPMDATTKEVIEQISFSFYAEDYDLDNIAEFSNSINKTSEKILGRKYSAGTLFLMPFRVTPLATFEDDGYTVKWKYFQVDMTMRFREEGWQRELLNVGNRARFNGSKAPEIIYQWYPFSNGAFATKPVWGDAITYHKANAAYKKDNSKQPTHPANLPFEYGESIPLTADGKVNTSVLETDITDPNYEGYPSRTFNEFKTLNWRGLDLPIELQKRWRV